MIPVWRALSLAAGGVVLLACCDRQLGDKSLLALYPGGSMFEDMESAPPSRGRGLPDCLRAQADVIGSGVCVPVGEARTDGSHAASREGNWTYSYVRTTHTIAPDGSTRTHYEDLEDTRIGPEAKGDYVHNMLQGPWSYWHPNGSKRATGSFVDDEMSGAWEFWLENGEHDGAHSGTYAHNALLTGSQR